MQPVQKQMTLAASFSKAIPYDKKSSRWNEIIAAVTTYIAKDMAPVIVVEWMHILLSSVIVKDLGSNWTIELGYSL